MNTSLSKVLGKLLAGPWRRFQKWRAMRMYAQVPRLEIKARLLFDKANRLMAENVPPPELLRRMEGK